MNLVPGERFHLMYNPSCCFVCFVVGLLIAG